ncbi:formyltetrahydrofolate deformylase [Candidatus Halobonum tyrrellensis]|uniref:Formyltetrahydrofolate deformylase n=1 Tax=Candidatus Halobonum tyrrellensis G22 TaxID=1324957 RepID=V4GUF4_9EURY|nr:formyltransferase family protein [Candidatus Halobonum tyrrellensis]ESP88771.1 formyltetrahydrofolate deformylase [Candidatus Halobonum tyrrellensis G22]
MRELTEIVVVGDDDTGLVARVTSLLFERGCNIEDLDQAVRDGVFRMRLHADSSGMVCKPATLREDIQELGDDLGVDVQVRFPNETDGHRVGLLVTKEAHAPRAVLEACADGTLDAEVAVMVGNRDTLESLAAEFDVPFVDVGDENGSHDETQLLSVLEEHGVDCIALARFMRILSPEVVFRYEGRIVNVHPSLLPAFPGAEAYRQAVEGGARVAGVTAHYVTTDLDQGPVIAQRGFAVPPGADVEELKERGQPLESEALVAALRAHIDDALVIRRGRTHLREEVDPDEYDLGGVATETPTAAAPPAE